MAGNQRQNRIGRHGSEADSGDMSARLRLEHLRRSFEKFRLAHRARRRIPQELRDAALEALRCGAPEVDVRRACHITPEQLHWWRRRRRSGERNRDLNEQAVRVFPVVDELAGVTIERAADPAAQELELRVGGWAISIRPVER
jgi:transposase-like protein